MKKLGFLLFIPLLVFMALPAKNAGSDIKANLEKQGAVAASSMEVAATEAIPKLLGWKSILGDLRQGDPAASQATTRNRNSRSARLRDQESRGYQFLRQSWSKPTSLPTLGTSIIAAAGDIVLETFDVDGLLITEYVVGDTITLRITYADSVWISIFIDNGDDIFEPAEDLGFIPGEEEMEDIVVVDGDFMDETDPGDGNWEETFDTGEMEEGGEIFSLQGATIFFYGESSDGTDNGLGTLDALPPVSTTTVTGNVSIFEPAGAAPNVLVAAFPILGMEMEGAPKDISLTMTDDAGNYELVIEDDVAGQPFGIFAMDMFGLYPGLFADPPFLEEWIPSGDILTGMSFTLKAGTAVISGTLKSSDGTTPIPDIRIFFEADGPGGMNVDTTDADGIFEVAVMPGEWWVEPSGNDLLDAGYLAYEGVDVEVGEGDPAVVDLVTYAIDGSITGTVVWSTEMYAPGAEVFAQAWRYRSWTSTDALGAYVLPVSSALDMIEFTDEEWGGTWTNNGYRVSVWAGEETLPSPSDYNEVLSGATGKDFVLYEADAFVRGIVLDMTTLMPIPEIELEASTIEGGPLDLRSWARTRGDGSFDLPLLGGHEWVVMGHYRDFWDPPAFVDSLGFVGSGAELDREYLLEKPEEQTTRVYGFVFGMDSYPIPNAMVELIEQGGSQFYDNRFTDGDGYYEFEAVPANRSYDIIASAGDLRQHFDIWVVGEDMYFEFWLGEPRVRVYGTVFDENGYAMPGALVVAYQNWIPGEIKGVMTDWDGKFEFFLPPSAPGVPYTLAAGADHYAVQSFDVEITEEYSQDFNLTPATLPEHVSGRVTDDLSNPIGYVWVSFISEAYFGNTNTDPDGYYDLGLMAGDYFAMFRKDGFKEEFRPWTVPGELSYDVSMMPESFLTLDAVYDVDPDHGKQLMLEWNVNLGVSGMFSGFDVWEIGYGPAEPDPWNQESGTRARHLTFVPIHPGWANYSHVARTLHDGLQTWYTITARGYDTWEVWDSNFMSGISEDNLAPQVPASVVASIGATGLEVNLTWEPSIDDPVEGTPVQYYTIYRGGETGDLALLDYAAEPAFSETLPAIGTYRYAVSATDFAGLESEQSEAVTYTVLSVADDQAIPEVYALGANYPNPFNPSTTITFQLPEAGHVTLQVYDLTGKVVNTLVSDYRPAGYHQVVWNGRDRKSAPVATGVYFYRIVAGQAYAETRKMVLMK